MWCGAVLDQGRSLLSGWEDGMLRRWVLKTGTCDAEVRAHQGLVRSLAVNVAEEAVATTGDDGAIRLWQLPGLTPCVSPNTFRPVRPYEGMNITGVSGLTSPQRDALTALGAIAIPSC
jgi:WD40 repeat protein